MDSCPACGYYHEQKKLKIISYGEFKAKLPSYLTEKNLNDYDTLFQDFIEINPDTVTEILWISNFYVRFTYPRRTTITPFVGETTVTIPKDALIIKNNKIVAINAYFFEYLLFDMMGDER